MEMTEILRVIAVCTYLNIKNLFNAELLLSWCNYKFMITASRYPGKTHKK